MRGQVRRVVNIVCAARGVSRADILSPDRHRGVSWPRQEIYAILRDTSPLSMSAIGGDIGGRDHTTVLHGIRAVARRCEANSVYASEMEAMRRQAMAHVKPVFIRHGALAGFQSGRSGNVS
jgi:chromosomal replication initiator protein